ncbi:syntaxin [Nitzschia inconspicua]|uniref:Syntaxin n=1 Tax=Nitzschia inconspicua TaxID=303405 RepID=A0A9K3LIB8_9STRA|nr:syntaxin [Nitzschia inconspicua]KAG7361471.1 syntaxin [Nitzschia inconspicua]
MNNRLGDVPAWAMEDSDDSDDDVPKPSKNGGDIEMQETKNNHYMENFFREVDSIKADIDAVSQASKEIAKIDEQSMRATTTAEEQKLSNMLKPLIDTTNKRAKRTKNLLGLLKEETEKLKADGSLNSSDIRVRENMITTLTKKFVDEMKIYQQTQQQYKTDIKNKVKRQVQVVKPDATDEDVDKVMRSEGGKDALLKQSILAGGVNDQIKTTYAKVAGKYQDVLTLEQSVAELHQMFLDFALLTEQQGELLDQIEFQVKQAGDYVEEANVDVHQAIEYQKSIRKKQCIIIIIVVVVIVIIVFTQIL